jgi:Predicted transcriptional regulator
VEKKMDGFDRIYDLHRILKGRKTALPLNEILAKMECSRATFNRTKRHMSDFLGAPIEYRRELGGYFYNDSQQNAYELPGIWLKEAELHALLLMQVLINSLGAGILSSELYPIEQRIEKLLSKNAINPSRLHERIRLLGIATREVKEDIFLAISNALIHKNSLTIHYENIGNNGLSERVVSPQRLLHYRHNWYLDCWCHTRNNFRTFSVDAIKSCSPASKKFKNIDSKELDVHVLGSYGLYSAENLETACIHFYPPYAKRIAKETWHPEQKGKFLKNGTYELQIPYNASNPSELISDVIKAGDKAKVIKPEALVKKTKATLLASLAHYEP